MPEHVIPHSRSPIACALTGRRRADRQDAVDAGLAGRFDMALELPDGYALRFPCADAPARLLAFVTAERACCPFFTFELAFEPDNGPVWLRLRGAEGVKVYIRDGLGLALA